MLRSFACNRALIQRFVFPDDLIEREPRPGVGGGPHVARGFPARGITEKGDRIDGERIDVAHGPERAGDAVTDDLADTADVVRQRRHAGRQRLERAQAERLAVGGQDEQIGRREQRRDGVDAAEEMHGVLQAKRAGLRLGRRALGAIADHHEHARDFALHALEDAHHVRHALHRAEVRDVHQDLLSGRQLLPQRGLVARAIVDGRVDEVVNHRHVAPGAAERADRFVTEEVRDGGDAVGLFDGELGDRVKRRILADDRDVRAVQRRDHGDVAPFLPQHLLRDPGARRVRNRVVHMQQVEPLVDHHLVHPNGEREIVWRILEQGIAPHVDFVEVYARQKYRQPKRLLVGDEVDLVPAGGERDPQLGRDRAGAAVRGITGDADLHSDSPAFHQASTRASHRASCGSTRVTRAPAIWFRNQVR